MINDKLYMKKSFLIKFIILFIIFDFGVWFFIYYNHIGKSEQNQNNQMIKDASNDLNKKNISKLCINNNCFEVEVVDKEDTREKWLMFRKFMDANHWMWFVFDNDWIYPFWMKNTLMPLDIIWVDSNYKIVFIWKNIQPCGNVDINYNSCPIINPWQKQAKFVLEINGGISDSVWINIWDNVALLN